MNRLMAMVVVYASWLMAAKSHACAPTENCPVQGDPKTAGICSSDDAGYSFCYAGTAASATFSAPAELDCKVQIVGARTVDGGRGIQFAVANGSDDWVFSPLQYPIFWTTSQLLNNGTSPFGSYSYDVTASPPAPFNPWYWGAYTTTTVELAPSFFFTGGVPPHSARWTETWALPSKRAITSGSSAVVPDGATLWVYLENCGNGSYFSITAPFGLAPGVPAWFPIN
jgi:hypothetical protein